MKLALACAVLFSAPAAAAQSVWTVDSASGPGATHTAIQAAIDAALDGDTVLVRPGDYAGFTVAGKGLVITAEPTGVPEVVGRITVRDVPATSSVVLRNFDQFPATSGHGLRIEACDGAIWVESCSFAAGAGSFERDAARVLTSDAVVFTRCGFVGAPPTGAGALNSGGSGLRAIGSSVALFDCQATGRNGAFHDELGGAGGHGVVAAQSTFFLSDGALVGGNGGGADDDLDPFTGQLQCGIPGAGGSGVEVDSTSSATLVDVQLTPGAGGISFSVKGCSDGWPGSAVGGDGTVSFLPGDARGLRIGSPRREGEATNLTFTAFDGDVAFALVAATPSMPTLPALSGALVVDPGFFAVAGGFVPTSGVLQLGIVVPRLDPAVLAATLYVQSAYVTPAAELRLGSASQLTIVDGSL